MLTARRFSTTFLKRIPFSNIVLLYTTLQQQWADQGECDKNPAFMMNSCAEACRRYNEVKTEQMLRATSVSSFFDLEATDIDGNTVSFSQFEGQVTVVTNVASQCGYTESHYRGLVELWSNVKHEAVNVLAFPCNQFGRQEPGTADEIKAFAKGKGVEFTMMEKIDVNGPNTSLVYLFLKSQGAVGAIGWNFATYFVIGPDGAVNAYNGIEPMALKEGIIALLGKDEF